MNLLTKIVLMSITALSLSAQTTMCYIENHANMATVNTIKLDGGLCQGTKTVKEMNNEGWTTEDIKINNNNYIYIFKKITTVTDVNMEELENRVLQRIKNENKEQKKLAKEKLSKSKIRAGKRLYEAQCSSCHGSNGEKELYGKQAITSLNLREFKTAIREYSIGEREINKFNDSVNPYSRLMVPYANLLTPNKTHNIYLYLKNLKTKEATKVAK